MAEEWKSSFVRIFGAEKQVVGAGFLVGGRYVVTCAHVISEALGPAEDTEEQPTAEISLDFPFSAPKQLLSATVVVWRPPSRDDTGDFAGLELNHEPPVGAKAARLLPAQGLRDHRFLTFGFPSGHDAGVEASGLLGGENTANQVQIGDEKVPGFRVEQGFSGAPVYDTTLKGVVGMVIASEIRPEIKTAFMIPTDTLVKNWSVLKTRLPENPYRGLRNFRFKDAAYFFGRESYIDALFEMVKHRSTVIVSGPSGSGKSSLVFAGLLPKVATDTNWVFTDFRPGKEPFFELANALRKLQPQADLEITEIMKKTEELAEKLRNIGLRTIVDQILREFHPDAEQLVLVADQFEQLFFQHFEQHSDRQMREANIKSFLDCLLDAVKSLRPLDLLPLTLVYTIRVDTLEQALTYPDFADAYKQGQIMLLPMSPEERRSAIEKPANSLNVKFETGLVERILDDVEKEPGNLPALEFALEQLWEKQDWGLVTHAAYEAIGKVEGALAKHADQVFAEFTEDQKKRVEHILVQMVHTSEQVRDTRRFITRDDLRPADWELVHALADKRLVVVGHSLVKSENTESIEGVNGEETTETAEIAHEELIRSWGKMREWTNIHRHFLVWRERLRIALGPWEKSEHQDTGTLLRGGSLAEAKRWLSERNEDLSKAERDFIRASAKQQELNERLRQERARQQAAAKLLSRFISAWLAFTLSLLLVFWSDSKTDASNPSWFWRTLLGVSFPYAVPFAIGTSIGIEGKLFVSKLGERSLLWLVRFLILFGGTGLFFWGGFTTYGWLVREEDFGTIALPLFLPACILAAVYALPSGLDRPMPTSILALVTALGVFIALSINTELVGYGALVRPTTPKYMFVVFVGLCALIPYAWEIVFGLYQFFRPTGGN